jgi:hypothetical protein
MAAALVAPVSLLIKEGKRTITEALWTANLPPTAHRSN